MQRISELEKLYVLEALENQFRTSKGSVFNNRLEKAFCNVTKVNFRFLWSTVQQRFTHPYWQLA